MDETIFVEGRKYEMYNEATDGVLWLGCTGNIPYGEDDILSITVKHGCGVITGSNERSVLIAAYRFLYELGCRWLHPGQEGEIIPKKKLIPSNINMNVQETASYRHRAICIEGAVSSEHVYNVIDWLPKVGMNGYFIQFRVPANFFALWSNHTSNPTLPSESLTTEDAYHICKQLEEEIRLRGLHHHAVGHGWTCDAIGLTNHSLQEHPEIRKYIAEVNGKREIWNHIPNNTNLCYSNPEVREKITSAILVYCQENPTVDHIHFWLADDGNNHCECTECRKMTPSDYYVKMLNELDRKLTAAGCEVKVVFLLYQELLWEPQQERIENPDRFVLMFAPSGRTYSSSFSDYDKTTAERIQLTPYRRNDNHLSRSVDENILRLSRWQEQFSGDSFDFDYHLMWDYVCDPGYHECAKMLHKDMTNLRKIGLNGMVSCQVQRVSFPTGLPMYSMAKALWNENSSFEQVEHEYFSAAFGSFGDIVREYTTTLTELFDPVYLRGEKSKEFQEKALHNFKKLQTYIRQFQTEYLADKKDESPAWKYLYYHAELCRILTDLLYARAEGDHETVLNRYADMEIYLQSIELEVHTVLDVWNYLRMIKRKFIDH